MVGKEVKVLAFVLAGGEGKRLAPLTKEVAKPAIPFQATHRLIDFALSNLHNSGVRRMHVLLQYQSVSVLRHLRSVWLAGGLDPTCFITPVIGGQGSVPCFAGTADAVYRNRREIVDGLPDVVAIFSADHIYRMDVRQMVDFHLQSRADATVAALPVPIAEGRSFGVIETQADGRIRRFAEKPLDPMPMPGRPGHALASMGNYLFSPRVLLEALEATHAARGTDFGGHLLPSLVASRRLMAYDFTTNLIPGLPPQCHTPYWRDVGTLDAYFAAHMDTIAAPGSRPRFDVSAQVWPIRGEMSAFDFASRDSARESDQMAKVAPPAAVEMSILRRGATVGAGAEVSRCILGDGVEVGPRCRLRNLIVESGAKVPAGFVAGFNPVRDREILPVSESGVVVIPRGFFVDAPRPALVRAPQLTPHRPEIRTPKQRQSAGVAPA